MNFAFVVLIKPPSPLGSLKLFFLQKCQFKWLCLFIKRPEEDMGHIRPCSYFRWFFISLCASKIDLCENSYKKWKFRGRRPPYHGTMKHSIPNIFAMYNKQYCVYDMHCVNNNIIKAVTPLRSDVKNLHKILRMYRNSSCIYFLPWKII